MKTLEALKTNICPPEVTLSKAESLVEILGLIKYKNIIITDFRLRFTPAQCSTGKCFKTVCILPAAYLSKLFTNTYLMSTIIEGFSGDG